MEILKERLEQVINLIPQYAWSLMDEAQKDELMVGIVLPRYMATTKDGTKLTPSTWAAMLGASPGAIQKRVERLKASRKSADEPTTSALTSQEAGSLRSVKSVIGKKPEATTRLVESLTPEQRYELGKALTQVPASAPISPEREKATKAAIAPLRRTVNDFAASVGTVSLIDRATDEVNEAVSRDGLGPEAIGQIEEAIGRLVAAVEFAKAMAGGVKG